jgi:hypothetical protein
MENSTSALTKPSSRSLLGGGGINIESILGCRASLLIIQAHCCSALALEALEHLNSSMMVRARIFEMRKIVCTWRDKATHDYPQHSFLLVVNKMTNVYQKSFSWQHLSKNKVIASPP